MAVLRAAFGLLIAGLSVNAVRSGNPHLRLLGSAEILFALGFGLLGFFAWTARAAGWAGVGLLGVMAVAVFFHAVRGELPGLPLVAAIAIAALWPARELRAAAPEDRVALDTLRLRRPGALSHEAHLRAARLYLQQLPLGLALDRFARDLRAYAAAKGKPEKFHQTMTVGFLLAMRAALASAPEGETFEQLLARAPALASADMLRGWYSPALLESPLARRDVVLPDRARDPAIA